MIDFVQIFLLTLSISYIGSLQIGPIGILAIFTTLKFNLKAGLKVAFVGVIPEYIYALVAYFGYSYLSQNGEILKVLQMAIIPLFLIFGVINFLKKQKSESTDSISIRTNALRAFKYGILNPLLISFWLLSLVLIGKYVQVQTTYQIVAFALATGTGGFLAKLTFSLLALRHKEKVFLIFTRYSFNKIIGVVFIIVAIVQFLKLIYLPK